MLILGLVGAPVPAGMQGEGLLQMLGGKKIELDRQDFCYEHTFMSSPKIPKIAGLVSREMKFMKFTALGYEELYDVKKDTLEKQNLARDPPYQEKLQKTRSRYQELKEKVAQTCRRLDR